MKSDRPHSWDPSASLKTIELFECLDDSAYDQVSKLIKWRQYKKGTEVVAYKGEGTDVYFIASGRVRITIYSFTGKEISYQELGPGKMFGELSAIDQLPRTATVITAESSRIGAISKTDYWRLIDQYPGVAAAAMKRLAGLVRFLIDRVYQYGALDVKDRIRMEILRLARESMTSENAAAIRKFPTHKEIANRVNTHREAVTRELNELSRMGLIEQNNRVLTVTSLSGLIKLLPEYI
jgi:CRP-like cAMP-binding protein